MESQDTATLYLLKIWPALEANKNRVIGGLIAVVLVILLVLLMSWQRDQKEVDAGQAVSQLMVSSQPNATPAQLAAQYLKIAGDYAGTQAAQRAQLQGAAILFTAGDYAGAQAQFQKFVDADPASPQIATAELGVASCLESLGRTDAAVDAYQKVIGAEGTSPTTLSAQFALGRIMEGQGKISEALKYYQPLARSVPNTTLGHQAALKAAELNANLAAKTTVTAAPKTPGAIQLTAPAK